MKSDPYKERNSTWLNFKEKVKLSPNRTKRKIHPKFIVLHDSFGSFLGTVAWISDPRSRVSYHYTIDPRDGSRVQHVWDSQKAWHAGRSYWKGYKNLNNFSIGIAFSGDSYSRDVSDFEIDSCARKCIYLMRKFGLDVDSIVTHQMIAPKRKKDTSPDVHKRVIERVKTITKK